MDWWLVIAIGLTMMFGFAGIVLAFKFNKRKKPVWAYRTRHIIGRDAEAPPELKLSFGGRAVKEVYKTSFLLYNMGNETIRGGLSDVTDIAENITIHFSGANILKQPIIREISKEAINFSVTQVERDNGDEVQLNFKYLGQEDGAIIEVWHTRYDRIFVTGDIMNAKITPLIEYPVSNSRTNGSIFKISRNFIIPLFIASLLVWLLASGLINPSGVEQDGVQVITISHTLVVSGLLAIFVMSFLFSLTGLVFFIKHRKFPAWMYGKD